MIFILKETAHVSERPSLGMTLPSRQFYFPLQYDGINYPSWSDIVTSGKHTFHIIIVVTGPVHQQESCLGYLAEALRRVLSVSLASAVLHHRQSCVVYLCFNPKSNHSEARRLATQQRRKQPQ